jgi:hypothetical protein
VDRGEGAARDRGPRRQLQRERERGDEFPEACHGRRSDAAEHLEERLLRGGMGPAPHRPDDEARLWFANTPSA